MFVFLNDFFRERCLIEDLNKMLRIPSISEENRLKWKRKMAKEAEKLMENNEIKKEYSVEDAKKKDTYCTCSGKIKMNFICRCPKIPPSLNNEPQQLFLEQN